MAANLAKDVITLPRVVCDTAYAHNDTMQGTMVIVTSDMAMYTMYMSKAEKPINFACTFQANVDMINTHGGCAGCHPQLVSNYIERLMEERGLDADASNSAELKKVLLDTEHQSCEEYLACMFILVADGGKHQGLKYDLDNQYLMDKDVYPCTMPQALKLLEQFKPEANDHRGCRACW